MMTSSRLPKGYVLWGGQPVLTGTDGEVQSSPTSHRSFMQRELFSDEIWREPVRYDPGASKATKGGRRTRSGGASAAGE